MLLLAELLGEGDADPVAPPVAPRDSVGVGVDDAPPLAARSAWAADVPVASGLADGVTSSAGTPGDGVFVRGRGAIRQ